VRSIALRVFFKLAQKAVGGQRWGVRVTKAMNDGPIRAGILFSIACFNLTQDHGIKLIEVFIDRGRCKTSDCPSFFSTT
jgi:hypothetical protein